MPEIQTFNLPDLGEGLTEGEILHWLVAVGDRITLNQPLVEVETAKAAVEIPSPFAGVVTDLHHPEGATVAVGSPIIAIDVSAEPGAAASPPTDTYAVPGTAVPQDAPAVPGTAVPPGAPAVPPGTTAGAPKRTPVLVGYGPRTGATRRRPRRMAGADPDAEPAPGGDGLVGDPAEPDRDATLSLLPTIPDSLAAGAKPVRHGGLELGRALERAALAASPAAPRPTPPLPTPPLPNSPLPNSPLPNSPLPGLVPLTRTAAPAARARAKPLVRKLARDLGVDLAVITGTGPHSTVSRDDVRHAAASLTVPLAPETAAATSQPAISEAATSQPAISEAAPSQPAISQAAISQAATSQAALATSEGVPTPEATTRERRIPVRGVRKLTAAAMVASVATAPHVTEFLTVDVTRTLKAVRSLRDDPAFAGVRVGPLLLIAKAVVLAVGRHPELNASWVTGSAEADIVLKEYVNLGIAAATPRGLLVPNIKGADRLPLPALAAALDELVQLAKAGRATPADLAGGTITITNVGVFGVDAGTPILNHGEAAILCVGQIAKRPWVHKGVVKPRSICQLALSFDHRVVDGAGASKFLADIGRFLTDPAATALAWR